MFQGTKGFHSRASLSALGWFGHVLLLLIFLDTSLIDGWKLGYYDWSTC